MKYYKLVHVSNYQGDYTLATGLTEEAAEYEKSHLEERFTIDIDIIEEEPIKPKLIRTKKDDDEQTVWNFVEENFPNYSSSDLIGSNNTLSRIINREYESDDNDFAYTMLRDDYGNDEENPQILIDYNQEMTEILSQSILSYKEKNPKFASGFTSWYETFFEVVSQISYIWRLDKPYGVVNERHEAQGTGGLYELSKELTDKFENLHKGRQWDGDFFDEIETFLSSVLKEKSKN